MDDAERMTSTPDLITRLREGRTIGTQLTWVVTPIHLEAADRIEALEAQVARLTAALQKISVARYLDTPSEYNRGWNQSRARLRDVARAALENHHG